jgi:hypothetical protein
MSGRHLLHTIQTLEILMLTNTFRSLLCVTALVATLFVPPVQAQTESSVVVKEYDVFVDLPTAFAFIKLPMGWRFIGKLDADQLRRLPAGTLTSLLPPDDESTRLAGEHQERMAGSKS